MTFTSSGHEPPAATLLCTADREQFTVPDFLHAFDDLISRRRSEIEEYLSRHPKLASKIQSLQPILTPEKYCSLPTPPSNISSPAEREEDDVSASVNYRADSGINSAATIDSRHRTILPRHAEPPSRSISRSASHDDCRSSSFTKRDTRNTGGRKRKHGSSTSSDDEVRRGYELAKAAADVAANELGTLNTLRDLQHALLEERNRAFFIVQEPINMFQQGKTASEQEVVKQLNTLQAHFDQLRSNKYFGAVAEKYERALIVQLFNYYKAHKKGKYSLGAIFTEITMKDWVRDLKVKTQKLKRDAMRKKWKDVVRRTTIWLQLVDAYGCGVLAILPEQLKDEHTRILNHADKEEFLSKIKAKHPNLKADLEDLTFLVWHLVTYKTLPQQCLLVETLHESALNAENEKNISELLRFVHSTMSPAFNSRVSSTDMLQRYEALSQDPTIPLQTAEQNSAIQRPVVANSYSMRGFDEPVEKHIDSAVLGPNVAQGEVE